MDKEFGLTDPYEIAKYIKNAKKRTPVKAYISTEVDILPSANVKIFGSKGFYVLIGEYEDVDKILKLYGTDISCAHIEYDRRNSAIPLLDTAQINARIEPGAVIRNGVSIGENAVIMMGAVLNIGACVGAGAMIDMNAVLGARAVVGKNAHIGAGAVLAGVLEPPSADPVIIEDNVLIGANAVVLEGVRVGKNAVVAAGSVVTEDVPEDTVVAGAPAKIIKKKDEKTREKTKILDDLRK